MANTASLLPTFPRIFFVYVEPIAMMYGMFQMYTASGPLESTALPLPTRLLGSMAMQHLFNVMLFSLVLLLFSPPSKRLAQLNIWILIIADFTHWAGLIWNIVQRDPRGFGAVLATNEWSPDVWTLATYPIGTLIIKIATLQEWFGKIRG